jgi:hypothetical protein
MATATIYQGRSTRIPRLIADNCVTTPLLLLTQGGRIDGGSTFLDASRLLAMTAQTTGLQVEVLTLKSTIAKLTARVTSLENLLKALLEYLNIRAEGEQVFAKGKYVLPPSWTETPVANARWIRAAKRHGLMVFNEI